MVRIQKCIPVTQAKSQLLEMIRQIQDSDDTVAITKNGVPQAVLMSISRYEGLLETLEILSDQNAMQAIRKSLQDAHAGRWVEIDEVFPE